MKTYLLIPFVMLMCFACSPSVTRMPKQGLTGYITEVSGNQMPGFGKPQTKARGVSRTVMIYAPTTTTEVEGAPPLFKQIKSKWVATTTSDSLGRYQVKLPPGKYSVFIKDAGGFFASETDGNGTYNPVEVRPNALTHKDVLINHRAVY